MGHRVPLAVLPTRLGCRISSPGDAPRPLDFLLLLRPLTWESRWSGDHAATGGPIGQYGVSPLGGAAWPRTTTPGRPNLRRPSPKSVVVLAGNRPTVLDHRGLGGESRRAGRLCGEV